MFRRSMALLAAIVFSSLAHAQTSSPVACPPADGAGKAIELKAPLDEPTRLGLAYALMIGVASDDRNWPHSKLGGQTGCDIGTFTVGPVAWTVNAGADAGLPRWAQPSSGAELAFLVRTPSIQQGYAYSQAAQKPMMMSLGAPMYALVVERQQLRYIARLYDDAPPTNVLRADMAAAVRGDLAPVAALDPDSGALSYMIATQSPLRAIIPGLMPGAGGKAAHLLAPDGDMFVAAPAGAVKMAKSGFVCPASALGFGLKDLWVGNATEDAHDLSCTFTADSGRIAVSITRRVDRPAAKSAFDDSLQAVKKASAVTGAAPPPLAPGDPPRPRFAASWTDAGGQRQGLWLAVIGGWYVEVLAAYAPAAAGAVSKAVGQIYKDAFGEIPAG